MNANEAKDILLLYRPGTADAEDPQVAEALATAQANPELASWLAAHVARQETIRAQFRRLAPPAGLKEQIISEHAASRRAKAISRLLWVSVPALVLWLGIMAFFWHPHHGRETPASALAIYQSQMVRVALSGYAMDVQTNDLPPIRNYLTQQRAPADFKLTAALARTELTGCAVRNWEGATVSLVCFRTGRAPAKDAASDLWLFVVDQGAVTDAPTASMPRIAKVNRLVTATWSEGGKLYFLGLEGEEADLQRYL